MSKSLQDQLLKAGLVNDKKAKQIKHAKRVQAKQPEDPDNAKQQARRAREDQAERDRAINRERQQKVKEKEVQAQIKQLIETNRIPRTGGEVAFSFVDGKKIKKLYLSEDLQSRLGRGQLAIVKLEGGYEVVPCPVAERIAKQDESLVISLKIESSEPLSEDDPYADYKIPDDLMW